MHNYISPEVDVRFRAHKATSTSSAARGKSIVDLALAAYLKEKGSSDASVEIWL